MFNVHLPNELQSVNALKLWGDVVGVHDSLHGVGGCEGGSVSGSVAVGAVSTMRMWRRDSMCVLDVCVGGGACACIWFGALPNLVQPQSTDMGSHE